MRRALVATSLSLGALFSPSAAVAQEAGSLGSAGQIILSADRLVPIIAHTNYKVTSTDPANPGTSTDSTTTISFFSNGYNVDTATGLLNPYNIPRLGFDYVVIPNLTIGGNLFAFFTPGSSHTDEMGSASVTRDGPTTTLWGIAPRVGFIFPFGQPGLLSLWLRGGVQYISLSVKTTTVDMGQTTTDSTTGTQFALDLDPQLVISPINHFGIMVGPAVDIPLGGSLKNETTSGNMTRTVSQDLRILHLGITAGILGYFGG